MVNFNNDVTYTRPTNDVNRMTIIEARHYVLDAIETYYEQMFKGAIPAVTPALKARIIRLFEALRDDIIEHLKDKDDLAKIKKVLNCDDKYHINNEEIAKIKEDSQFFILYHVLSKFMHDKRITEFINAKNYDPSNPIDEDKAAGL